MNTTMWVDLALTGTSVRQPHKHRKNTDYIHKKSHMRIRHLPAVTLTAVRNTGNPNHPNARVSLLYDETMGVSVFVAGTPLRRNDYVSFYSVKESLTGDQFRERYLRGASTLTDCRVMGQRLHNKVWQRYVHDRWPYRSEESTGHCSIPELCN